MTKFLIIFFAAHCQNGEVPGGFWKCEDLQADVDDGGIDEDDDSDDWSILTGVGHLIEPRHGMSLLTYLAFCFSAFGSSISFCCFVQNHTESQMW